VAVKTLSTTSISQGRVLIVDGQPSLRASYARSLVDAGFEAIEAAGSTEALRRIEKTRFDLVITDVLKPKMGGLALVRELHTRSPGLPVILLLDAPNNRMAIEAAELGALQSLVKPIDGAVLERTATLAIRLSRLRPRAVPAIRNHLGEPFARISATEAKNKLGQVLDSVIQGGVVLITRHETPKAVLISMEEYGALARATATRLDTLNDEFDALLARMQTPKARAGMKAAFDASPKRLGRAAVAVARKRG
jgi:antitoxin Phd